MQDTSFWSGSNTSYRSDTVSIFQQDSRIVEDIKTNFKKSKDFLPTNGNLTSQIHTRDVYEEVYFDEKNLYKWAKHGFTTTGLCWKYTWVLGKEKVARSAVSKENQLRHERSIIIYFLEKGATVNSLDNISPNLLNDS